MDPAPVVATPRSRRRPFGIIAVAALLLLNAFGLLAAALELTRGQFAGPPLPWSELVAYRSAELAMAVVTVAGAVGLLMLKRWGWILAMVIIGVGLVGDLLRVWYGNPTYLNMLLHVVAAFYLNGRSVRALASQHLDHADEAPG
jgi:hypothetical protein